MKFTKSLVAAGIALSAIGAQAQLVTNGSFESLSGAVAVGGLGTSGTGWNTYSSIAGWTGNPDIEVRVNTEGLAQEGMNFVELDTTRNSAMFQNISIATAGEYLLSFWYSARPSVAAGSGLGSNTLSFAFGALGGNVLEAVSGGTAHSWKQYTGTQYLAAGTTKLTFAALGASDRLGGSLDNVSVTAVPEVETYAMMLAGLGLMGTIARRRKAKAA